VAKTCLLRDLQHELRQLETKEPPAIATKCMAKRAQVLVRTKTVRDRFSAALCKMLRRSSNAIEIIL
jgi:hypothetical protein